MKAVRVLALAVVALLGPGLAFAWAVIARGAAETEARRSQARGVEAAQELVDAQLDESMVSMRRLATVLASASRFKVALSTRPVDQATLEDSLKELQDEAHFDWVALASAEGQVLAQSAEQRELLIAVPRTVDSLKVVATAKEGRVTSQMWFLTGGRALVVAAGPIVSGPTLEGVVLVARVVPTALLDRASALCGGSVGLKGPGGAWVGAGTPPSDALGRAARSSADVQIVVSRAETAAAPQLLWAPLVIVGIVALSLLLWIVTFRDAS